MGIPWTVQENDVVGRVIHLRNPRSKLPAVLLPKRLRLESAWVSFGGSSVLDYYFAFDGTDGDGLITFPTIPGDGGDSHRQAVRWAMINGYKYEYGDDPPGDFVRPYYHRGSEGRRVVRKGTEMS